MSFVARPRIDALVERGVSSGLTVVSASAGSGKTLALASWARQRITGAAWLTLDSDDADPHHLWRRVLRSVQASQGLPPGSALARLKPPARFHQRFVSALVHACDELPGNRVVVLDDAHVLRGSHSLASLAEAIRAGLGSLRLVISSRIGPALPLQRLRLSGELTEIGTADLAFDEPETARLMDLHDVQLSPDQLRTVLSKTEGWAAGLRLTALMLQSRDDQGTAVAHLAGENRTVADYFVEEVLARQSPELTQFLLDTSVVGQISAGLADALTGRSDSQRALADLERRNLFTVALDSRRTWFRYHHMFRELLQHRLRVEEPGRVMVLHRRAARWYAENADLLESARHWAAAGDWPELGRLVNRSASVLLLGDQGPALVDLLNSVPTDVTDHHPELSAVAAMLCGADGDAAGIRSNIERARQTAGLLNERDTQILEALLRVIESVAASFEDRAGLQVESASDALERLDLITESEMPALPVYRLVASLVLAAGLLWTGRTEDADQLLRRLAKGWHDMPAALTYQGHSLLAVIAAFTGRLRAADDELHEALGLNSVEGSVLPSDVGMTHLAEAIVHLLRAEFTECAEILDSEPAFGGLASSRPTEDGLDLVRAQLALAARKPQVARSALTSVERHRDAGLTPPLISTWIDGVDEETRLQAAEWRSGPCPAALPEQRRAMGSSAGPEQLVLAAREALAANKPRRCLELLAPLTEIPQVSRTVEVDAWLQIALANDRLRRDADALIALGSAVRAAESGRIARPFVVAGQRALPLLERLASADLVHSPFVPRLLKMLGAEAPTEAGIPLADQLTNRERGILMLLPSMMSNAEIADELCVSVNTVKVHLKTLYRKLGVKNRRAAVLEARRLGVTEVSGLPGH